MAHRNSPPRRTRIPAAGFSKEDETNMSAPSAKSLFRAMSGKAVTADGGMFGSDLPEALKPAQERDPLDYDPTPAEATEAFLAVEGDRMRQIGGPVWESAVGGGHMARVLQKNGFHVRGSDIVQREHAITCLGSFYDFRTRPANLMVTNPPYCEVNARDGHGRWLRHAFDLGIPYIAMLLNWEWIAARINGLDELHERFPVSRAYVCCWKIDFRGAGAPPQRNAWLVWDRDWQGETVLRRLYREAGQPKQGNLI